MQISSTIDNDIEQLFHGTYRVVPRFLCSYFRSFDFKGIILIIEYLFGKNLFQIFEASKARIPHLTRLDYSSCLYICSKDYLNIGLKINHKERKMCITSLSHIESLYLLFANSHFKFSSRRIISPKILAKRIARHGTDIFHCRDRVVPFF